MAMINSKKGFVFSLLAFFLSLLIFAYALANIETNPFTKDKDFVESRVQAINNELDYFKGSYLQSTMSYSGYNVLSELIEYSRTNNSIERDYPELKRLLKEGMINGSFYGIDQDIENRTLSYLFEEYKSDFDDNYLANITIEYGNLTVYEEEPFYITLRLNSTIYIETRDNITSWKSRNINEVQVPAFDLVDPSFSHTINQNYTIRPAELFTGSFNWGNDELNQTIRNVYSAVHFDPSTKYTVGQSTLNRLVNNTFSSYQNAILFYSFDYDLEENELYDTTGTGNRGQLYGDSLLLMSFDDDTESSGDFTDKTGYENIGSSSGISLINDSCISGHCLSLGSSSYIDFGDNDSLNVGSDSFSFSFWYNSSSTTQNQVVLRKGSLTGEGFSLGFNDDSGLEGNFWARFDDGSSEVNCIVGEGLLDGNLSNLIVNINRQTNNLTVYLNSNELGSCDIGALSSDISNSDNLFLSDSSDGFEGIIDELGFYKKSLNIIDVVETYRLGEIKYIEYNEDSKFGTSVYFDGKDDRIHLTNNGLRNNFALDDFTIETWFLTPENSNDNLSIIFSYDSEISLGIRNNSIFISDDNGNDYFYDIGNLENKFNYINFQRDSSSGEITLYYNDREIESSSLSWSPIGDGGQIFIATSNSTSPEDFFKGHIDELKVYNRTMQRNEVLSNYYNFDSNSKGCCNYIALINPNLMGFNNPDFDGRTLSYSSKLFLDYLSTGEEHQLTLYDLTNFTQNSSYSDEFYNLRFDMCLMQAFNVFEYDLIPGPQPYNSVEGTNTCADLIRKGIY